MRALLWVTCGVAALWGGYWVAGSRAALSGAEAWLAQSGAAYDTAEIAGFPNRFDLTVTGLQMADPDTGITWAAPFAQVFAMTWKPWHLIAALPNEQTLALPDQTLDLGSTRMMGSLLLVPGPDLALNEVVVEGEGLRVASSAGWVLAAEKLVGSTRADGAHANSHRLGLSVSGFAPDPALIQALAATGLPATLSDIHLDATVTLSAPLDRHASTTNPRLRAVDLRQARLVWGTLKLFATGEMAADAAGFAAGKVDLRVEGWRALPPLLAALGLIAPDFAPTLERGLQIMAQSGGDADVVSLALTAKDGRLSLGPFPLGPAPFWK